LPGAHPTIGEVGKLERVAETKLEMVLPRGKRAAVVAALRAAHPYEEPAFDVLELADLPSTRGLGRIGTLPASEPLHAFVDRVAAALLATAWGVRAAGDPDRPVRRVAVCGGAGDSALGAAVAAGVDAYVTADLRHHPASEHLLAGQMNPATPALVDVAHWASEWPWCAQAADILRTALGGSVEVRVSTLRTDPWTVGRTQPIGRTQPTERTPQ
jgi:putative NIF3 family GTP cyclohydrolase 1 type 2